MLIRVYAGVRFVCILILLQDNVMRALLILNDVDIQAIDANVHITEGIRLARRQVVCFWAFVLYVAKTLILRKALRTYRSVYLILCVQ